MKKVDKFFFICGICMSLSEIYKQLSITFIINNGHYNWWHFPFQLCSIPMYLSTALPFIHNPKAKAAVYAFFMDFSLLGGIAVFFDTSGMHYNYKPLTMHSYIWHVLLIILGILSGIFIENNKSWKTFKKCVLIYVVCCIAATLMNITLIHKGRLNMFYISPYFQISQIFFTDIADKLGNSAGILIYIASTVSGALILHSAWRFLQRLLSKSSSRQHFPFGS